MPNELLRTITIDGVSNDALGVGSYLTLNSSNNVELPLLYSSASKTISLASNSIGNHEVTTLTESGWYFVLYSVEFAANSSGARFSCCYDLTANVAYGAIHRTAPSASGVTVHSAFTLLNIDEGANKRIGLRLFQNSGSALNVTAKFYLWRIPKM